MKDRILAVDQSTSGTKALLFDEAGGLIGRVDLPHRQIKPRPGWVEHDPEEIYRNTVETVRQLLEKTETAPERVAALGISNQRETVLAWDEATGKPVYNAVVWQCARAEQLCRELEQDPRAQKVPEKTGLNLSPYFSAAKLSWILKNVPEAQKSAQNGTLRCGNGGQLACLEADRRSRA